MYHNLFCQNNKTLEFNWQKTWRKYIYFQQTTDKTLYPNAAHKLSSHMILKHFFCLIFVYSLQHQRLRYLAVSSTDKNSINTVDKKKIEKDFKKYITSKHFKLWMYHCVKSVRIRIYSGPNFPAFGLNMEWYAVSLCIQSECG